MAHGDAFRTNLGPCAKCGKVRSRYAENLCWECEKVKKDEAKFKKKLDEMFKDIDSKECF